jgi:D-alanyl-D-alanine dipeptidase
MSPLAAATPAETAEHLRAYLMSAAPACRPAPRPGGCGELVDVRQLVPGIVALPAPPWSDAELRFMVRPEMAERLRRATAVLPSDIRLGFWEGLRPLSVQRSLWSTGLQFLRTNYPDLSGCELELALEPFVARPDGVTPPHSTGSAVDVAAVDAWGRVLHPGDAFGKLGTDALGRALRQAGLASYDAEWWHWSYGDEEWARAYDCAPLAFAPAAEFDGPGGGI